MSVHDFIKDYPYNNLPLEHHIIQKNRFLKTNIDAYYCLDYTKYRNQGNPDFLVVFKNTYKNVPEEELYNAAYELFPFYHQILELLDKENLNTICVVPRSKARSSYQISQLFFLEAIRKIITVIQSKHNEMFCEVSCSDGSDYIIRHTDTRTTHLDKSGCGGDGDLPYPGITTDTCSLSDEIRGKRILLIDDIYTKTVNVDEDCIQALLDKGAEKVILFTIARTKSYLEHDINNKENGDEDNFDLNNLF